MITNASVVQLVLKFVIGPHCGLQAKFEDVYASNNVQVVFARHCHGYERTMPIYKNQINKDKGVVYITTGAGGRGDAGSRINSIPKWSTFAEGDVYGSFHVLVATREKMQVVWFGNDDLRKPLDKADIFSSKFEGMMLMANTTNSSTSTIN
ncbi:hypothetical protein THRCLA_20146 [Thraustotheca clavata]|uniref:Purple acid phosphatase C-terminal domain-containing protein n=1 Tax=Thraustotheca clavata TaxID=74557 RepID=A0A1W0AB13_9STRA|nr:hypothetical protein THRCLA_20146 [Thraustotheca clavata]